MSVTDLMANRYSERRFSPAPVEDEKLQAILAAGALAPTAENKQPQRILVVRGDEALAKMDKCTRCRFGAPVVLVLAYDMTVAARHPDVTDFGTVDIAIVGDHMSLAAEELGVHSCWVGLHRSPGAAPPVWHPADVQDRGRHAAGLPQRAQPSFSPAPHAPGRPEDRLL